MGESVVRLLSRNGETSVDTTSTAKGKKGRKRRRVQQNTNDGDEGDDDADESHFEAARSQLLEEMVAAGLAADSLPMSFGSKKQQNGPTNSSSSNNRKNKRKRVVDDDENAHGDRSYSTTATTTTSSNALSEFVKMEKVHVKFDSDGEVAERVVEAIEQLTPEPVAEDDNEVPVPVGGATNKEHTENFPGDAVAVVQSVNPAPVDKEIHKFWKQRKHLFYKYEDGILLDHESWYSVTPQAIAEHIALRLKCDVVVDPFAGCGGNVIQLALQCRHVIAIDIDPEKIRMARHNAAIYGVAHKIEWIVGNSVEILPTLKADAVFLSPPWGGVRYSRDRFDLDEMLIKGVSGRDLFEKARQVTKNIAYYLPKTTPDEDLEALAPEEFVECEKIFLNKQLKVVTAYYGNLAKETEAVE